MVVWSDAVMGEKHLGTASWVTKIVIYGTPYNISFLYVISFHDFSSFKNFRL